MTTNLSDLNKALFDQLGRLNNPELTGDALEVELRRASSVTSVSKEIVSNARLVYDAARLKLEYGGNKKLPDLLEVKE